MTESNRIEYKRELTEGLEKEAVAFLNYHDGGVIYLGVPKFELFTDRLEITSAGSVHSRQEQDDFFAGYSMPRNKTLMRVFKDLEMVEYLGSGMPRILKAYSRDAYTFSSHFIRTTLPISQQALALEREVTGESTPKNQGLVDGLVESQQRILILIRENPRISKREMADSIGISTTAIDKNIIALKDRGLLQRIGSDKSGHWALPKDARE